MHALTVWFEGNLSVDHGGPLQAADAVPCGLVFDPQEVAQALCIPLEAVTLERMTFGDGILASEPFEACCFPYAQHYLTSRRAYALTPRNSTTASTRMAGGRKASGRKSVDSGDRYVDATLLPGAPRSP